MICPVYLSITNMWFSPDPEKEIGDFSVYSLLAGMWFPENVQTYEN